MNSLDAYEHEIAMQLDELPRILKELRDRDIWLSKDEQRRAVITGSGDSYACALAVERLSSFNIRCIEPYELASISYDKLDIRTLYIISVSGETRLSIEVAKRAKEMGLRVVALTSNASSRLAGIADSIVELRFKRTGVLTAGSISFTTSLLTAASLVKSIDYEAIDVKRLLELADTRIVLRDYNYIVGDVLTYPIAVYFSAKIYEVLGLKAQYCMLEGFKHMQMFSIAESDKVIILSDDNMLAEGLSSNGIDTTLIGYKHITNNIGRFEDILSAILYTTFLAQRIVLINARAKGFKECSFITNRFLRLSSSLIY